MTSHQGRKAWQLIGKSRSGPQKHEISPDHCAAKKHQLSHKEILEQQNEAQHQTRQLGSWKARPRIKTRQQGPPPKHANPERTSQTHNILNSWTHNRRIWDKGQKAIIKEECSHNGHTSMTYQHEANLLRVSLSWVTNHIYIRWFKGPSWDDTPSPAFFNTTPTLPLYHLLQHNQHHQPQTPRPTKPSKSHNSYWLHGTSRRSSTLYVLTYCKT